MCLALLHWGIALEEISMRRENGASVIQDVALTLSALYMRMDIRAMHERNLPMVTLNPHKWNCTGTMCSSAATRETLTVVLYRLNVIIDRLKLLLVQSNVVRGCSQLSTFSLAYSCSWTLPHPESVQEDDPAISSGVIALFVFSVFAPGGQVNNQTEPKLGLWVTLT
jgi:hypothetical protein